MNNFCPECKISTIEFVWAFDIRRRQRTISAMRVCRARITRRDRWLSSCATAVRRSIVSGWLMIEDGWRCHCRCRTRAPRFFAHRSAYRYTRLLLADATCLRYIAGITWLLLLSRRLPLLKAMSIGNTETKASELTKLKFPKMFEILLISQRGYPNEIQINRFLRSV